MTRQIERQNARTEAKSSKFAAKLEGRRIARRALLERQTAREKAGAYSGRSTASLMAPSRSRIDARKVRKGKEFGRILKTVKQGDRELTLHATKGWRSNRAA